MYFLKASDIPGFLSSFFRSLFNFSALSTINFNRKVLFKNSSDFFLRLSINSFTYGLSLILKSSKLVPLSFSLSLSLIESISKIFLNSLSKSEVKFCKFDI